MKAWTQVSVEAIEAPECYWCSVDDRTAPVTHAVYITHWYGALGATARHHACKAHAEEIAAAFKPSTVGQAQKAAADQSPQDASGPRS